MTKYLEYTVVMVFVSSILTLQQKQYNMSTIKEQIELLTTVKLILEIDGRKSEWKVEDELKLTQLKCKYYNINTTSIG